MIVHAVSSLENEVWERDTTTSALILMSECGTPPRAGLHLELDSPLAVGPRSVAAITSAMDTNSLNVELLSYQHEGTEGGAKGDGESKCY